jgi:hypothetical protein
MAVLTSYEGSNDDFENTGTSSGTAGQSFKLPSASQVTSISIYGARGNTASGTFKVEIVATSMTGTVLTTTGTLTTTATLTTYAGGAQWNEISVTPVNLDASTTYFLRLTAVTGSTNDEVRWSTDTTSPSYADGTSWRGTTQQSTRDKNFRINGTVSAGATVRLLALTGCGT